MDFDSLLDDLEQPRDLLVWKALDNTRHHLSLSPSERGMAGPQFIQFLFLANHFTRLFQTQPDRSEQLLVLHGLGQKIHGT